MAAKSFYRRVAGKWTQIFGIVVSAGAANDGDIPALDATGRLDGSVMPVGLGADTASILASEALAAGDLVNVYTNAGAANVRKADASTPGKEANGFVLAAVSNGANATVYFEGTNTQRGGLTPGSRYYLAATAGSITATPITTVGQVDQFVGTAVSATALSFEPDDGVNL